MGASYFGMVLDHGPRSVTPKQAAELVAAAGRCTAVAVVTVTSVEEVLRARDRAGFAAVQLHGDYSAADARRLAAAGLRVWQVARLGSVQEAAALADSWPDASAVLVEPRVAGAAGGAGVAMDPAIALAARGAIGGTMVLAGGLTAATVAELIALIRPEVVDVSSGVESRPGMKDPEMIERFMEAAGVSSSKT